MSDLKLANAMKKAQGNATNKKHGRYTMCNRDNATLCEAFVLLHVLDGFAVTGGRWRYAGGIKRHNFKRGLMAHGSKSHRQLGRVYERKIPGRMRLPPTKIVGKSIRES
ncbi:uncharacterized protein LOC112884152 [Panicum hallii]|uniref:uncharacterized protein LOC112884152 n=1 Tax=Panicum hallii TaxID=206008 RepID=UPI000DF4D3A6|nr:uncharacterized protein LOC112884152 [Panicum hallii]